MTFTVGFWYELELSCWQGITTSKTFRHYDLAIDQEVSDNRSDHMQLPDKFCNRRSGSIN